MYSNWIVQNLNSSLGTWNDKLAEIWTLLTQSPEEFKGGVIWTVILNINGAMQAIGLALLVLFFVVGVMKSCGSLTEIKRPEQALKLFLRFAIAKIIVTYGLTLMLSILEIVQGIINSIMISSGLGIVNDVSLPDGMIDTIESVGFFDSIPLWAVSLIGSLLIMVLSFVMIMIVYGRFFKLYIYTAIAPIPLSTLAGESTQSVGKTFLKSFVGVCLEGAIIVIACVIFSVFASTPPIIDTTASAVTQVWVYMGELIFNLLILVGTIKMSDRVVKEMMGL